MAHLVAIHEHIARDSPRYASRMVDRITARTGTSMTIAQVPEPGAAALALGGIATFCLGGGAVTRWKKWRLSRTRTAGEEPAADLPPSLA